MIIGLRKMLQYVLLHESVQKNKINSLTNQTLPNGWNSYFHKNFAAQIRRVLDPKLIDAQDIGFTKMIQLMQKELATVRSLQQNMQKMAKRERKTFKRLLDQRRNLLKILWLILFRQMAYFELYLAQQHLNQTKISQDNEFGSNQEDQELRQFDFFDYNVQEDSQLVKSQQKNIRQVIVQQEQDVKQNEQASIPHNKILISQLQISGTQKTNMNVKNNIEQKIKKIVCRNQLKICNQKKPAKTCLKSVSKKKAVSNKSVKTYKQSVPKNSVQSNQKCMPKKIKANISKSLPKKSFDTNQKPVLKKLTDTISNPMSNKSLKINNKQLSKKSFKTHLKSGK